MFLRTCLKLAEICTENLQMFMECYGDDCLSVSEGRSGERRPGLCAATTHAPAHTSFLVREFLAKGEKAVVHLNALISIFGP
jgi:hypothetical protein